MDMERLHHSAMHTPSAPAFDSDSGAGKKGVRNTSSQGHKVSSLAEQSLAASTAPFIWGSGLGLFRVEGLGVYGLGFRV